MSAEVLPFKPKPVQGTQPRGPQKDRLWFCTKCESRLFQIELNGDVWCGYSFCGGYITNLKVKS
jgi:hypothetical protein